MSSPQETPSSVRLLIDVPLSPHWAFVVQFRATPEGTVYEAGRIEHLASGRITHFQSLEELHACLSRELHASESVRKQ